MLAHQIPGGQFGSGSQIQRLSQVPSARTLKNADRRIIYSEKGGSLMVCIIRGEEEIVQFVTQMCLQSLEKLNDGGLYAAVLTSRSHRSQVHRDFHRNGATDYTDSEIGPKITRI